jgi:hypothetical protein
MCRFRWTLMTRFLCYEKADTDRHTDTFLQTSITIDIDLTIIVVSIVVVVSRVSACHEAPSYILHSKKSLSWHFIRIQYHLFIEPTQYRSHLSIKPILHWCGFFEGRIMFYNVWESHEEEVERVSSLSLSKMQSSVSPYQESDGKVASKESSWFLS